MKVSFKASVKQLTIRSLVSGDESTRILIEKDSLDVETLNQINKIRSSELNKSQELIITISDSNE